MWRRDLETPPMPSKTGPTKSLPPQAMRLTKESRSVKGKKQAAAPNTFTTSEAGLRGAAAKVEKRDKK